MKKNNSFLKILGKVYHLVITTAPISGILSVVCKVIEGIFPAYITMMSAALFNAVTSFLANTADIMQVKNIARYCLLVIL